MKFQKKFRKYRGKAKRKYGAKKGLLTKMVKDIKTLKKNVRVAYTKHYLYGSFTSTEAGFTFPYWAQNLCNFNTLAPCFGTNETDINGNSHWKWDKMELDLIISANTEKDNMYLTCHVVSLKKDSNLYSKTSGNLFTLTNVVNYINNGISGLSQTSINPDDFTIHYTKRIILGNNSIAGYAPTGTGAGNVKNVVRKKITIYPNTVIKNPDGNVRALTCNQSEAQQYFLIIFNDNSNVDIETPLASLNVLHTIRVPGG